MRTIVHGTCVIAALALSVVSGGCDSQQSGDQATIEISGPPPASGGHDHDHAHGEEHEGPHGGHVIELGRNHEYHAELVDDDNAGTVTIYILDKDLKELPIDKQSITLNLMVEGEPKMFELKAPGGSDTMASRFDATDEAAFEALHEHGASGKLRVTIKGSSYSGDVEHHDHHHGDHDHDHGDHDHDH